MSYKKITVRNELPFVSCCTWRYHRLTNLQAIAITCAHPPELNTKIPLQDTQHTLRHRRWRNKLVHTWKIYTWKIYSGRRYFAGSKMGKVIINFYQSVTVVSWNNDGPAKAQLPMQNGRITREVINPFLIGFQANSTRLYVHYIIIWTRNLQLDRS